jgi:uncharacterized protein (DUF1015 family)
MVDVRPFRGLRFDSRPVPDLGRVVCPPYDVISPDERRALVEQSPFNVVRVELPEAESGDRYAEAARTLEDWRARGVLVRDESPSFYLYEVQFRAGGEERARRALVAAVRLEPWESGQVLPHERTMAAPKEDRLRLMRATRANVSPLWTLYRGRPAALERAWAWADSRPALASFQLEDGTAHRIWRLADGELIEAIRRELGEVRLVIADGHHRYETALRYRDEIAGGPTPAPPAPGGAGTGPEHPANFVLAHLVAEDDPGLVILPTHRLVRGLGALDQAELESEIGADWHGEYFPIWENAPPEQLKALLEQLHAEGQNGRVIGLFGPDTTIFSILILRNKQLMERRAPDRSEAWRGLDVALLDEGFLKLLLERAGLEREAAVAYERDPYAALQAVLRGEYQLALFLNATRAEQVIAVAEAGDRMPEKSTYFYPKPPTGLVMREL